MYCNYIRAFDEQQYNVNCSNRELPISGVCNKSTLRMLRDVTLLIRIDILKRSRTPFLVKVEKTRGILSVQP
ncbi:MAG: hypothetical protein QW547_03600 [Candidatus Bathyarchaeia archaeon]